MTRTPNTPPNRDTASETTRAIDQDLAAIVGAQHVSRARDALAAMGMPAVDGPPAWVLRPGSAAEVAELIGLANRHRIAVVPVGSSTRFPETAPLGERMCLFVNTGRMDQVLHLDETSLLVHVQAGLTALGLERVLAPRRLSLGDYPPAAMGSTIGGLLAVRTPGKSSSRHGFVEDAVQGISAVLADGRSVHTRVAPRRATGPDLARMLCGSEGTLGFITSVVLRIHRRPESRFLAAHALPDFEAAISAVHLALREEAAPAALRVYDSAEARAHLGAGVVQAPEAVLVVATAGATDLAACDRDLFASAAEAMGGRRLDDSLAQIWWRRRTGREHEHTPPLPAMQITASPARQKAVYRAVCRAAGEHGAHARAHVSRFDHDGAVLFFTFARHEDAPRPSEVLADDALQPVREAAALAAEEAGGLLLGRASADLAPYLADLRGILDPGDIMNPGALPPAV